MSSLRNPPLSSGHGTGNTKAFAEFLHFFENLKINYIEVLER